MQIKVPKWFGRWIENRLQGTLPQAGTTVIPPAELNLSKPTLLYFKAENCVACGPIDLFIGQLASHNYLDLRVIDFRRGALPETVYGGQLLLDQTGELGRRYGVRAYPTLIVTTHGGEIRASHAGGAEESALAAALGLSPGASTTRRDS